MTQTRYDVTFFKESSDNWAGNYKIERDRRHENELYVRVSLRAIAGEDNFQLSVWGNDDFGMVIEGDAEMMSKLYTEIAIMDHVSVEKLAALGLEIF